MHPPQLNDLVDECAPLVVGARVENVHQSPDESVSVSLYSRDAGKLILLFGLRPGLARFHLVSRRPAALLSPPSYCGALRKHLKGAHVEAISAEEERRSVRLVLRSPGEEARARMLTLLFEIKGERGRLTLEGPGKSLQTFEGGSSSGDADDASRVAGVQPAAIGTTLPPLHARLAALYSGRSVAVTADDRRNALRKQLRRALSKRERLLVKIDADLERALRGKEAGQQGELLKGALGQLRRGMRSVEVQNYFDPAMPRVEIVLDPARTPVENIELYFKRYKKAQRGVPIIEERLARLTAERDTMRDLERRLDENDAGAALDLDVLEPQVRRLAGRAGASAKGRRVGPRTASRRSGPRRFVSADGLDILVGRTASGNDELTFRVARGNDLFLHVAGRPGSHVIVRLERGRPLPPETLVDAAYLAVYYSLRNRSLSRVIGAAAEVDYTPVKYVRKPRGGAAGLVLLANHKTVRVRIEEARLKRLLEGGDRGGAN